MGIFLYIFFTIAGLSILAFLLPVRINIKAAGDTDTGFEWHCKVMIFAGHIGGGLYYFASGYRLKLFLHIWKVLDADVTSIVRLMSRKVKKRPGEKPEIEVIEKIEEKRPLVDLLKKYYQKRVIYWGYFKEGLRCFCDVVRFDHLSSNVKLGLKNPVITGKIIGILYALNGVLPDSFVITPSWDFTRTVLRGDVSITLTFISLKFWKHLIYYTPCIVKMIINRISRSRFIIAQEVQ